MALSALATPACIPPLLRVATTGMKVGEMCTEFEMRQLLHEAALRTQAVEGLEACARNGHQDALAALVEVAQSDSLSVKAIALTALREVAPGNEAYRSTVQRLPESERYLVNLQRTDVRSVPQITDPTRHLLDPSMRSSPAPRLVDDGGPVESVPGGSRATPRANRQER